MAQQEKAIVYTQNPQKELLGFASQSNVSVNLLDYHLLAYSTQYRFGEAEWEKIAEKHLSKFDDDEIFLRKDLQITQSYKIEIFQITKPNPTTSKIKLVANKTLTKLVAQIDLRQIKYHDNLALELLQEIYKKMIKLKLLVGIRIFDFKQELLNAVNQHHKTPFKSPIKITIAKGIEPVLSQDENLHLLYLEKTQNYTLDEKRSGIVSVDENEVVLRHTKLKQGSEGRNLNLQILEVVKAQKHEVKFTCSDAFKSVENENGVDYIALKKGFVTQNGENFDIANALDFNNGVDFKNIGVIKAGLDKNVKINIRLNSDLQDAVNSGVGIECEELSVSGSVAGNTNLRATKLNIEGTTHTKAKIYAIEGRIKTHRGYAEGKNFEIDLLEGGTVKGEVVKIKKSLGGVIEADKIYIEGLVNNNTCIFYENAVVANFEGTNNKFQAKIKTGDKNYEEEFLKINHELDLLHKKMQLLKQNILNSQKNVAMMETQVKALKAANKAIPTQYTRIINDYNALKQDLLKAQNIEKALLDKKNKLILELKDLQDKLLSATFINKSGKWSEMNEIKFTLIEPKTDVFYASTVSENIQFIGLKKQQIGDGATYSLETKASFEEKDIEWLSQSKA